VSNRYFVGDTDDAWSDDTNWASSSGGVGGAGVPTAADNAIFDGNSPDCVLDDDGFALNLTLTAGFANTLDLDSFVLSVGGTLTVLAGTLDMNDSAAGVKHFSIQGGSVTLTDDYLSLTGDFIITGGTLNPNGGIVQFAAAAGTQNFNPGGQTFYSIELIGATTVMQAGDLAVEGLLINKAGCHWNANGHNINAGGNGITVGAGTLQLSTGTHTCTGSSFNQSGGVVSGGGCMLTVDVNLSLAGGDITLQDSVVGNEVIVDVAMGTVNLGSGNHDFGNFFQYGGAITSTSGNLSVKGQFYKSGGTFNHNGGTVTFYDAGVTAIISSAALLTFNNLTFGASKTHSFTAAQSFRVNGVLASNGTGATKSVIVSGTPGTYWNLRLAGTSTLANKTNITDCDASAGVLVSAVGSTDGGHNLNIDFAGAPPTPAVDFPVGANIPAGDEDWFYQYDLDPATLRAWNTVGNWAFVNNQPALVNCGCFSNGFGAPPGIGDTIEFRFVMTQGRYNFRFWCPQDADCGIISIAMNGYVIEPALDLYAAPAEPSYVYLLKNRVLVPAGLQRLVFTVTGKNAGSSNFYARMYGFQYAPFLPQLVV
jgi:hypothetical protein